MTRDPQRVFTMAEQHAFAEASGDRNPIHLDPEAARRTLAGAPVAHGVHVLLWALETALADGLLDAPIEALRVSFQKFVHLDQPVTLHRAPDATGGGLEVRAAGQVAVTVRTVANAPGEAEALAQAALPDTPLGAEPRVLSAAEIDGAQGWLAPVSAATTLPGSFPRLTATLGAARLGAIALLSTVVGMVCPGRDSIFSSLDLRITPATGPRAGVGWRARRADPRYPRVDLAAAGSGIAADLRALIRPGPVSPPAPETVAELVRPGEFAGRRALIIGGSRGLGAATALLLAAGGGEATLTYASGREDAEALVAAIEAHGGPGGARALRCDVREPFDPELLAALAGATHIYYFATPHIHRQSAGVFSREAFDAFVDIYVVRFEALCRQALAATAGRRLDILYPSSVAISERPRGMTEYAMAKSAGEILCHDLARAAPGLSITTPRLPRVLTDQTAIAIPVRSERAEAVMLPLLRAERTPG